MSWLAAIALAVLFYVALLAVLILPELMIVLKDDPSRLPSEGAAS
jgi:hypothetical protein